MSVRFIVVDVGDSLAPLYIRRAEEIHGYRLDLPEEDSKQINRNAFLK